MVATNIFFTKSLSRTSSLLLTLEDTENQIISRHLKTKIVDVVVICLWHWWLRPSLSYIIFSCPSKKDKRQELKDGVNVLKYNLRDHNRENLTCFKFQFLRFMRQSLRHSVNRKKKSWFGEQSFISSWPLFLLLLSSYYYTLSVWKVGNSNGSPAFPFVLQLRHSI